MKRSLRCPILYDVQLIRKQKEIDCSRCSFPLPSIIWHNDSQCWPQRMWLFNLIFNLYSNLFFSFKMSIYFAQFQTRSEHWVVCETSSCDVTITKSFAFGSDQCQSWKINCCHCDLENKSFNKTTTKRVLISDYRPYNANWRNKSYWLIRNKSFLNYGLSSPNGVTS